MAAGSMPGLRPRSALITWASRSSGRMEARPPPYFPMGVRTESITYAVCMAANYRKSDYLCVGFTTQNSPPMAKFFDAIQPAHQQFIEHQKMFFVASAPLEPEGHVNLSPKGG